MSTLSSERVETIFLDCLFKKDEDSGTPIIQVEGIRENVEFHPGRLTECKAEIEAMLDELPDAFKESGGGGMSFLNACQNRHGHQWTGQHDRMEQLFQLGMAVGKVRYLAPRKLWRTFHAGMPYYIIS